MRKYWKCNECESVAHHKGLCRECTTYGEDGSIINPVPRERVDSKGNKHVIKNTTRDSMDLARMKQKFVDSRRRKLSKKQLALAKKEAKALMEAQAELEKENNGEIVEFGESVEEE